MKIGTLAAIVMAGVIGATLVTTTRGSRFTNLPDVTTPWQRTFTDLYHTMFAGSLSVYVQRKIDGNAVLHTSIGDIQMSSGRVDKKYSQGFYRLGHKAGKWTYFDERGTIRKIENWHDGRLIQTRTANQAERVLDSTGNSGI